MNEELNRGSDMECQFVMSIICHIVIKANSAEWVY